MFSFFCVAAIFVAACNAQAPAPKAPVAPIVTKRNDICQQRNAYYNVADSCDSYVVCREFEASQEICPDGLHFNPNVKWPEYPCGYPMDVPCEGRGSPQPAQANADCPHQYGYFQSPMSDPKNCGQYRFCVAGQPIEMSCPAGLAFNPETSRCDWPDLVPSCNDAEFLGFSCPASPIDAEGKPIDQVINYRYEGNCFYFFSCELGRARLLQCDEGMAFDPVSGRCLDEELVACEAPPVLN